MKTKPAHLFLLASVAVLFAWSLIRPYDYFTWFLEVLPALIGLTIVITTYNRFRLSDLVYCLIAVHAVILMIGGHYTYARVPLFTYFKRVFNLRRNDYDRLGHVAQGFIPAIISREILLRKTPLKRGGWLVTIIISICLAISALYELFEWSMAEATGSAANNFLGTQGDPWDTQWDMFSALCGAAIAMLTMRGIHDKSLENIEKGSA